MPPPCHANCQMPRHANHNATPMPCLGRSRHRPLLLITGAGQKGCRQASGPVASPNRLTFKFPAASVPPADNAHPFAYHYKTGHRPQSFLRFWGAETHSPRQDFIFDGCRSSSRTSPFGEDSFSGWKALRAFAQFACQPICTT
ncbi:hypothetical protein K443DRAFT_615636 [Laccaria amethystina LaAM-08-1]|uniref:Uncharacterized protein n=1 Tax=Laccaria amethystina LaAM-08-1 TaxID=1095629 RepID=A0A0C9X575_9AGAR|nr:hypothetical protein K443DRAFT_615636 [Laccaria amethystina LaAM-08-1]